MAHIAVDLFTWVDHKETWDGVKNEVVTIWKDDGRYYCYTMIESKMHSFFGNTETAARLPLFKILSELDILNEYYFSKVITQQQWLKQTADQYDQLSRERQKFYDFQNNMRDYARNQQRSRWKRENFARNYGAGEEKVFTKEEVHTHTADAFRFMVEKLKQDMENCKCDPDKPITE